MEYKVYIKKIVDGDTIHVAYLKNKLWNKIKVRLLYIDAPEKDQYYGNISTKKLETILPLDSVAILRINKEKHFDRYGRILGIIYIPKNNESYINVNKLMVSKGYAWSYSKKYIKYQKKAKKFELGLWSKENIDYAINPKDFRKSKRNKSKL